MELSDPLPKFLIRGVCVDRCRQWRDVPREPLCKEQIPRGSVDVRDRSMPKSVEGIQPVEPGLHLPRPKGELNTPRRDPALASL